MSEVLKSTLQAAQEADHVSINRNALNSWCEKFTPQNINHWFNEAPFNIQTLNPRERLHFLLVFNSISFSYWSDNKWHITYKDQQLDGAYGMIAALGRAIEDGIPITNYNFLAQLSEKNFQYILRGENKIPLFQRRLEILREIGKILQSEFSGETIKLIESVSSSEELLVKLVKLFPSFQDTSLYKGRKVSFNKRAQLFIADAFQAVEETRKSIKDISSITACADYKLPLVLRRHKIFEYSDKLNQHIRSQKQIGSGHPFEIEIRSNTIRAVELMKAEIKKRIPEITSIQINDHLWLISQEKLATDEPYHRTRTTAY